MTRHTKALAISNKLHKYSSLHSDELSEAVYLLQQLTEYIYCFTGEFQTALIKEMELKLKNYKKYATIVEHTETTTQTYKILEWDGKS